MMKQIVPGGVGYRASLQSVPSQMIGSTVTTIVDAAPAIYLYAEPDRVLTETILQAVAWHVPFGVLLVILSVITLKLLCMF